MSKSIVPLQSYFNDDFGEIRGMLIDGVPYFVGKDVAAALGYQKERNAIATHVDDEDKKDAPIQGVLGGKQKMTLINESGMYSLIFGSKLPTAKKFKRWVTADVLPSIRKTGAYVVDKHYQKWLESRANNKISHHNETDAIKLFIEYAYSQGCTWSKGKFYSRLSVWANIGAGLPVKNGRDNATSQQLNLLAVIEGTLITNVLYNGINDGSHWTQIWARVKLQINSFLQVTFQKPLALDSFSD